MRSAIGLVLVLFISACATAAVAPKPAPVVSVAPVVPPGETVRIPDANTQITLNLPGATGWEVLGKHVIIDGVDFALLIGHYDTKTLIFIDAAPDDGSDLYETVKSSCGESKEHGALKCTVDPRSPDGNTAGFSILIPNLEKKVVQAKRAVFKRLADKDAKLVHVFIGEAAFENANFLAEQMKLITGTLKVSVQPAPPKSQPKK